MCTQEKVSQKSANDEREERKAKKSWIEEPSNADFDSLEVTISSSLDEDFETRNSEASAEVSVSMEDPEDEFCLNDHPY